MLLGPHDIARRLQYRHGPGWSIWYGPKTRQYWALAPRARTRHGMFGADTPEALEAAIAAFETLHAKSRQRPHALAD
jgi:hypothetical protein